MKICVSSQSIIREKIIFRATGVRISPGLPLSRREFILFLGWFSRRSLSICCLRAVVNLSDTRQAPPLTSEEIESMLRGNRFARICTHNQDGTIHATPVSYRYINGQILILTNIKSHKVKNIERNNDVTVLVDEVKTLRGIQIHGTAEIEYDNIYEQAPTVLETASPLSGVAKEKVERIAKVYVDTFKLIVLKITPKNIESFDYGKYELWSDWGKTLSSMTGER